MASNLRQAHRGWTKTTTKIKGDGSSQKFQRVNKEYVNTTLKAIKKVAASKPVLGLKFTNPNKINNKAHKGKTKLNQTGDS